MSIYMKGSKTISQKCDVFVMSPLANGVKALHIYLLITNVLSNEIKQEYSETAINVSGIMNPQKGI